MSRFSPTASQTVGPFFHGGLLREDVAPNRLALPETLGERICIVGRVYDGDGIGIPDALIELWQANHAGRYHHPADGRDLPLDPAFNGYGRTGSDDEGAYWFETIRPGRVPFDEQRWQAPHICVAIFARGLLNHLLTRLYFADEPLNASDPVLLCIPAERRKTVMAERVGLGRYHFDIVLQGTNETVFFNI
jgi:protocatechuate 3,4-dioxygenase alpha subunit